MHFSLVQISLLLPTLALGLPSISSSHSLQDFDISSSSSSFSQANTASSFDSPFDSSHESNDDLYRYQNKVYLIRHGEKGSRGETGLNSKGKKRAKCLRKLLSTPRFKIGLILAESFDRKTHKRKRPFDTVKPIANELGLKVDTDCQVDDAKCVRKKIERYARKGGKGDVLICWKHSMLHVIAHELGTPKTKPYPDERYDIMWTLHHSRLISKESEQCPGLDPKGRRKHDKDLKIYNNLNDNENDFDTEEEEEEEEEGDLDEEEDEFELDWMFGRDDERSQLRLEELD